MTTILGLIAAICFLLSGVPLMKEVFQASSLKGFSKVGWSALFIALIAITWQLFLLDAAPIILTAQVFNTCVVLFVVVQVFRKGV